MRRASRLLLALAAVTALVGAPAAYAQRSGAPTRQQLDSDLARATDVSQLLEMANRYADAGYQQEAKSIVDRAARNARSSADWQAIAAGYLRLGYSDNANAAQRKARGVSR
jgi:hypothetical protein